jgi:hypothetical protein
MSSSSTSNRQLNARVSHMITASNRRSKLSGFASLLAVLATAFITSCSEIEGGDVVNSTALPLDSQIDLHCEDAGVYPDTCILDDPNNPYARANVTEATKFELSDGAPSAKARFYMWATMLAKNPSGENQYYTALSLHQVYSESASPLIQAQTKKAYRSVLDNFFSSVTFYIQPVTQGDVPYAVSLKDIVGTNLYNPTSANLVSLYSDPIFALEDMSQWGYVYDTTNEVVTRWR